MTNARLPRLQLTPLEPAIQRIESAAFLDPVAKQVGSTIRGVLSSGKLKDAVSGTWLGHALHPMLTDVVIGSFTSASLLDLLGGDDRGRAAERLIAMGIAAYGPTALTGVNDWADTEPTNERVRRAGLVHAVSNALALSLYTASLLARRRGARREGAFLGAMGATVLSAGGYLGGHLTLTKGVGPNQTVFDQGSSEWSAAADASQVPDGRPTRVLVQDTPVLLLRRGEDVFAIHDRCSHRGCSLSEGELDGDQVICACHGSRFDIRDGSLRHGPATSGQPAFQVRQRDGVLEIRLLSPGSE